VGVGGWLRTTMVSSFNRNISKIRVGYGQCWSIVLASYPLTWRGTYCSLFLSFFPISDPQKLWPLTRLLGSAGPKEGKLLILNKRITIGEATYAGLVCMVSTWCIFFSETNNRVKYLSIIHSHLVIWYWLLLLAKCFHRTVFPFPTTKKKKSISYPNPYDRRQLVFFFYLRGGNIFGFLNFPRLLLAKSILYGIKEHYQQLVCVYKTSFSFDHDTYLMFGFKRPKEIGAT